MGHIIAMAGKGGTGKTTVAALLVRIIRENNLGSILAVDADPNSNLGELLGLEIKDSIGCILDDIAGNPQIVPVNMGKDAFIEYRVQRAIIEADGFDLLTMGRPEGPGCYCYVNNSLRNVMDKLINGYDFVIIDTPPIIPLTDAAALGTSVDGVVMVVQTNRTKREVVHQAEMLLQQAGCNLLGFILTNASSLISRCLRLGLS